MRSEILRTDSKATVPIALFRNEGVAAWLAGLAGAVRGMREMQGVLYVVAGTSLYSVTSVPAATILGTVAGSGAVDMSGNGTELVIVNAAGTGYVWNESTDVFATITDPDFVAAAWVEFLDQFMVFGRLDGEGFFLSALADAINYDALDTASAESAPDDIVMGKVVNRDLLLFGTDTLEVWYNAGLADFPLERAPSGTVEIGCAAKHSVAICDNAATWLGRYRGGLSVRRLEGRTPVRISTPALDDLFDSFTTVDDAIGQSYNFAGHDFYQLIFPTEERTFCWDAMTKLWHERSYQYPGDLVSAFVPPSTDPGDPGFGDATEWTGDDGFTVAGGVATFEGGMILALDGSLSNEVVRSADGITWEATTGTDPVLSVQAEPVWVESLGQFWVVRSGAARSFSSTDGNTWAEQVTNTTISVVRSMIWVEDLALFVIGSEGPNPIWTSPDGITWTQRTATSETIHQFAYSPTLGRLIGICSGGGTRYSSDGITWTTGATGLTDATRIVWNDERAEFLILANGQTATSPDGINWTVHTGGGPNSTSGYLAWSPSIALYVGMESGGNPTNAFTSPDGITWTERAAPNSVIGELTWFDAAGLFVAIEGTSGQDSAWTSPDGINWTERALPAEAGAPRWNALAVGSATFVPGVLTNNTVHFARPGRAFTATASVLADVPTIGGRVGLTWLDSAGAEISTDYAAAYTMGTGGVAQTSSVTATAPAGTEGVSVSVQANGPATFDDATLEQTLYASGSTPVEWRANSIEFAYGKVLVGDGLAGRIGFIDRDTHQEFDFPIPWVTTSSPITKDRRLLTHKRVEIEIDAGRSTSSDPRVWLQWSDNDGRTWSGSKPRSMGAAGKYKTRLIWNQLGSAYSRIYRVFGDDPSPSAIVAAYVDIEGGV